MRVKIMSFDLSASLDIISVDRRYFGVTKKKQGARGSLHLHKTCKFSYVFLI